MQPCSFSRKMKNKQTTCCILQRNQWHYGTKQKCLPAPKPKPIITSKMIKTTTTNANANANGNSLPNRNVCRHQIKKRASQKGQLCTSSPLWRAFHGSTDAKTFGKRSRDQVKLFCQTWKSRLVTLLEPHCKSHQFRLTRLQDCNTARLPNCYLAWLL